MRPVLPAFALALLVTSAPRFSLVVAPRTIDRIATNDNREPAGVLRNGVLTIHLEAREGEWHPDGDADPGLSIYAFAERGKRPLVPGPLIRVPEGTEIHATVTNALARGTLVVRGLSRRGPTNGTVDADSFPLAPAATKELHFIVGAPGTYYYSATVQGVATEPDRSTRDAELHGAFVVDARTTSLRTPDRVFVIGLWSKKPLVQGIVNRGDLLRFTINGKAWPNTERLAYAAGDTVRFRLINTTAVPHPMHLHGFYFDVESRGDGRVDSVYQPTAPPYRVVTERLAPFRTFSMRWIPERTGNWMFHCHDNYHVLRNAALDGTPLPPEHLQHVTNHARDMMGGLVMGIEVRGREAPAAVTQSDSRRKLRLVARVDPSGFGTVEEPAFGFELQEGGRSTPSAPPLLPGPTILLRRGEPVSITVVNALSEATSVHWHGIELESYYDGVAGLSGAGRRISPAIAPGDSFEARFTPPRAGTFMYHPHADESRQQQAGLSGVLLVLDDPASYDPATDIVMLLTVPRREADGATILLNGSNTPQPLELRVGRRYRLRLIDVHTYRPSMIARLFRDSTLVTWRLVAKDGMPVPVERATLRAAQQQMGNGETYDFEIAPTVPEDLRFTVWSAAGDLLVSMPVRIR